MDQSEIKPSFSFKYLVLTLLTTMIISAAGLGVTKLYESKPKKELGLINGFEINLLNDEELPKEVIEAKYFLKSDPKKEISTLFRKKVSIENLGNEGVENLNISAVIKGDKLFFASDPKITTSPKEIIDAIVITKGNGSNSTKHDWVVSLLNPGEIIMFEYSVYSEESIKEVELNIIPRKKDWTITEQLSDISAKYSLARLTITAGLTPIVFILSLLLLSISVYRIQWVRRKDFRESYSNFFEFYMKHRPNNLFGGANKRVN